MSTPYPLTNIIYYGFFTTDLTVTLPDSTLVSPTNFACETLNSSNQYGISTYLYIQNISLNNNNLTSSFKRINDSDNLPSVINFTGLKSTPYNNDEIINYDNLTLLNTSNFYYINSTINYKYPSTGFLYNFDTTKYTFEEYIRDFNYVPISQTTNYTLTSIDDYLGILKGNIQVNFGSGDLLPGYVGNSETIYNPFMGNKYNNYNPTGNQNATGWIIYSTDY